MKVLNIAIIQGGFSTEAEVSRVSAAAAAEALLAAGHRAMQLELDENLGEQLRTGKFDVVFPVIHGAVGEDGCLQGLLECHGAAYVGSDVLASALAMNKAFARRIFETAGLPIARGMEVRRGDPLKAAAEMRSKIGRRLVVKPCTGGSGIGVMRFDENATDEAIAEGFVAAWQLDENVIVEHFAMGLEITCGVLDVRADVPVEATRIDGAFALPVTEIGSPMDPFYTYEARYTAGRSHHTCPAKLPAEVTSRLHRIAVQAHRALGCRDLSRVDFVVGDVDDPDAIFLLEVNTLPGFTSLSLYPEQAAVAGLPFPQLCDVLAREAFRRGPTRRNASRAFPS